MSVKMLAVASSRTNPPPLRSSKVTDAMGQSLRPKMQLQQLMARQLTSYLVSLSTKTLIVTAAVVSKSHLFFFSLTIELNGHR